MRIFSESLLYPHMKELIHRDLHIGNILKFYEARITDTFIMITTIFAYICIYLY
jgi:hypothetical protein